MRGERRWLTKSVLFVLVMAFLTLAGAAVARPHRPARRHAAPRLRARLSLDVQAIRVDDVVFIDPSGRWSRGRTAVTLSFGDGSRSLTLHRLRVIRHRYRRAGRFTIVLEIRQGHHTAVARRTVTVRRRVVRLESAAGTVDEPGSAILSVGTLKGRQVVMLRRSARVPRVGQILWVADSPQLPQGLLGRVIRVQRRRRHATRLVVSAADLNQAYRLVDVSTGGSLDEAGVLLENNAGRVIGTAAGGGLRHIGIHLGGTGVRCTGFDAAAPPVTIDMDLSRLHWDLSFTYPSPSIHFLVTGSPQITVNLGLNIATECHWTLPIHIVVPIPGTPLQVKISPVLELSTDASLGAVFTWSPRLTYGFDRGNGISQEVHVFNPGTATLNFAGQTNAELFFGPDAELSLGGRVGVSVTFGPDFSVSRSVQSGASCEDADVGLKIQAQADANVFIAHWTFTLFSGTIGMTHSLYHNCTPSAGSGNPGPGGGSPGPGPGSGPGSGPGGGNNPGSGGGTTGGPPPAGTYAETAGGLAHTWTDYSDAGGTEGPSISAYATVGITCRVQGFQVADGNTWWYQIASSPWNNAYYVSADAFYNNGQTSGSLHGTPFYDPAVAVC